MVYDRGSKDDYGTLTDDETTSWITTKAYALEGGGSMQIYLGSETQEPDPTIESFEGAGDVPAFRGTAYLVFSDLQLERFGNRRPNVLVEFIATNDNPAQSYELVKTIDVSDIHWGSYPHSVGCWDNDGTAHFFSGNWTFSDPASGLVRYYKVFPSGATSFIKQTSSSTRRGIFGHQGRFPAFGDGTNGRTVNEPLGALHDPDLNFSIGLNASGLASPGGTTSTHHTCQIGTIVGGLIAYCSNPGDTSSTNKFRIYKYEKSVEVGLIFPDTEVDYDMVDITHPAGATYAWTLTENYVYMLITGANHGIYQYSTDDGSLVNSWVGVGSNINSESTTMMTADRDDETKILWGAGTNYYEFNTVTAVETEFASACTHSSRSRANNIMYKGGLCFEHDEGGGEILVKSLSSVEKQGERLDRIVTELCEDSGLTSSDIDVTALTGITVDGFTFSAGSALGAITNLMTAYQFSAYEDENKIIFKLRDGSVDKTISADDLACGVGGATDALLPYKRIDDQNLPRAVNVHFSDYANEYARGTQQAKRLRAMISSEQVLNVELPLVLTANSARQIAEKVLNTTWTARVEYEKFTLPMKYVDIVPTDILSLSLNGTTHEIRTTSVTISDVVEVIGVSNDQASYSSDISGFSATQSYRGGAYTGPPEIYLLNLPPLRHRDSDEGFYFCAHGYHPDWKGCTLYSESPSGGYVKMASAIGGVTAGVALTALADANASTIDYASTLTVRMRNGTPASSTEAAVLADHSVNAIAVGSDGAWEIMQFVNATDNGDDSYTLDTFIRGKVGTEWAMDGHAVDDLVIWLDSSKMVRAFTPDTGTQYEFTGVSFGQDSTNGQRKLFTNTGYAAKPLSPVHVTTSDAGGGNFDVAWTRRGRVWGDWRDLVDVPLGEASEEYTVKVIDTDQTTEVSSTTVSTNAATVAASAGQYVKIAQNSDFYGAGEYTDLIQF